MTRTVGQMLNDNMGSLLAIAIVAIVTQSIIAYGKGERTDERLEAVKVFMEQQQQINAAQIKISEAVSIMATRMNYVEKDLDRVYANTPALTKKP